MLLVNPSPPKMVADEQNSELRHARVFRAANRNQVFTKSIFQIQPSPENDKLYKPVDPESPDIIRLAESVKEHGLREPIVLSLDDWIVSGHRRYTASLIAGLLEVPVRYERIVKAEEPDRFLILLREYNEQRVKSKDEQLREASLSISETDAYQSLIEYRATQSQIVPKSMVITGTKKRCEISTAKREFLSAIKQVLADRINFLPISDRQIHYALLNNPPLKHASKPDSRYDNTAKSYNALTELLTRARIAGDISMDAIGDETRPVVTWTVYRDRAEILESKTPSTEFQNFNLAVIMAALKSLDIPFSFYDESHTNFFGSRGAWLHYKTTCEQKQENLQKILNRWTAWRIQLGIQDGEITLPRGRTLADVDWEWVPRGMQWWDAAKEVTGDLKAMGAGLDNPYRICQERDRGDFEENIRMIEKAKKYAAARGVTLSFDAVAPPEEKVQSA